MEFCRLETLVTGYCRGTAGYCMVLLVSAGYFGSWVVLGGTGWYWVALIGWVAGYYWVLWVLMDNGGTKG